MSNEFKNSILTYFSLATSPSRSLHQAQYILALWQVWGLSLAQQCVKHSFEHLKYIYFVAIYNGTTQQAGEKQVS